jgi:hypothetical protein
MSQQPLIVMDRDPQQVLSRYRRRVAMSLVAVGACLLGAAVLLAVLR